MSVTFKSDYRNILIFSHSDNDGLVAAFLVKKAFDNNMENSAWETNVHVRFVNYSTDINMIKSEVGNFQKSVEENGGDLSSIDVYITDFAIEPYSEMLKFITWVKDRGIEVKWFDHHKSALDALKKYNLPGMQEPLRSTAELMWKHFHGDDAMPRFLEIISEFDSYEKNGAIDFNGEVLPIAKLIESFDMKSINDNNSSLVKLLDALLTDYDAVKGEAIKQGSLIRDYLFNEAVKKNSELYEAQFGEYKCLVLNSCEKDSFVFEAFEDKEKLSTYDLLVIWNFDGEMYKYSLYAPSKNSFIDVGDICKTFLNGGGHATCGGGTSKEMVLKK